MKKITYLLFAVGAVLSLGLSFARADEAMKADRQAIDSACTQDAATAGCGKEVVGKGLLKCLHAYKKANPTFKFSEGCHTAMKQFREDKKAGK